MRERPIIFGAEMVRAILEGRKTQTRRVVTLPHMNPLGTWEPSVLGGPGVFEADGSPASLRAVIWHTRTGDTISCPYGNPGDRMWVRETWADVNTTEGPAITYRADGGARTWHEFSETFGPDYGGGPSMDYKSYPGDYSMWIDDLLNGEPDHRWKSPIHMPRWASRITLEVTDVRVERIQEITCEDVYAEGLNVSLDGPDGSPCYIEDFSALWDEINGPGAWERNDWVWVVNFRRAHALD